MARGTMLILMLFYAFQPKQVFAQAKITTESNAQGTETSPPSTSSSEKVTSAHQPCISKTTHQASNYNYLPSSHFDIPNDDAAKIIFIILIVILVAILLVEYIKISAQSSSPAECVS